MKYTFGLDAMNNPPKSISGNTCTKLYIVHCTVDDDVSFQNVCNLRLRHPLHQRDGSESSLCTHIKGKWWCGEAWWYYVTKSKYPNQTTARSSLILMQRYCIQTAISWAGKGSVCFMPVDAYCTLYRCLLSDRMRKNTWYLVDRRSRKNGAFFVQSNKQDALDQFNICKIQKLSEQP
jgi:hypothetical protein